MFKNMVIHLLLGKENKKVSFYNTCFQSTEMQKIWTTTQFAYMFLQIPFAGIICCLSHYTKYKNMLHVWTHACSVSLLFFSFYI